MGSALQPSFRIRDASKSLPLFGLRAAIAVASSGELSPGRLRFQSRFSAILAVVVLAESLPVWMLPAKDVMMRASGGIYLAAAAMLAVQAVNYRKLARRAAAAQATGSGS